jgi:hypothetical protein
LEGALLEIVLRGDIMFPLIALPCELMTFCPLREVDPKPKANPPDGDKAFPPPIPELGEDAWPPAPGVPDPKAFPKPKAEVLKDGDEWAKPNPRGEGRGPVGKGKED